MSDYFPNGLPRLVTWYEVKDGIHYVPSATGELLPVLDDHWIVCDTKKSFVVCLYYPYQVWEGQGPVTIEMASDYHSNEEEAMEDAEFEQKRLELEGRYIPIYHRN